MHCKIYRDYNEEIQWKAKGIKKRASLKR